MKASWDTLHLAMGLVASANEEEIWVLRLRTRRVEARKKLVPKVSAVKDIQFSPNGRFISLLAETRAWDISSETMPPIALHIYEVPNLSLVLMAEAVWGYSTCWSPDSARLFWTGLPLNGNNHRTVIVQIALPSGETRTLLERPAEESFGEIGFCSSSLLARMTRIKMGSGEQLLRRHAIVQVLPTFTEVCSPQGGAGPAWDSTGRDEILCTGMQTKERSRVQSWRSYETQDLYRCRLGLRRCTPLSVRFPEPIAVESLAISPSGRRVVINGVMRRLDTGIMVAELKQGAAFRVVGQVAKNYRLVGWCSETEVLVRHGDALVIVDVNRQRQSLFSRS